MSVKLGPEIQYAWDKHWVIEWNVPSRETVEGAPGKVVEYEHNLVIQMDLQDGDRNHVREFSRSITLFTTDHMLTVEDRISYLTGREIRRQIIDNLVRLKNELAGYRLTLR